MSKEDLIPFKKGEDPRRNLNGRPIGSRNLTTLLEEALRKMGEGNSETYDILLVKRLMKKAIAEGDMKAITLIWDRLEGRPIQAIEHSGEVVSKVIKLDE